MNVTSQEFFRQCRRNVLLRPARQHGTHHGRHAHLRLAALREQVGSPAEILCDLSVGCRVGQGIRRNGAAYAYSDPLARLLQKFVKQESSTNSGMQQADQLKCQAVPSTEIDRERQRSSFPDESRRSVIPLGIGNLGLLQLPMRNLAGGEYPQGAAAVEPLQGLFESPSIALCGIGSPQRIDENAVLLQLRNILQQEIRQDLYVWATASQHYRKHSAVKHPVGMVRDRDQRALARNPFQVCIIHPQLDIHLKENVLEYGSSRGAAGALVECMRLVERQQLAGKAR